MDIAFQNADSAEARHHSKADRVSRNDRLFMDVQSYKYGAIFCRAGLRLRKPIHERSAISLLRLGRRALPRYRLCGGQQLCWRKSCCLGRMNTPPSAVEWLREKCEREHWSTVRHSRTITREWVRHMGGRIMRAGLSGAIQPAPGFELLVHSPDIEDEYVAAAKNAAISLLVSQSWSPVFAVRLELNTFVAHAQESSYAAFYAVAHEVVSHLLGVAPGSEHNIDW